MTDLIACLSTGKGTWAEVNTLIQCENWERVFLITNAFGKENFKGEGTLIVIDQNKSLYELAKDIKTALQDCRLSHEVALNFSSGIGKEHMALLCALLGLGVGIRLVYTEQNILKTL